MPPHVHLLLGAEHRLVKLQVQILAQVGATLGTTPATPALAPKQIPKAEKLAKDVAEILEDGRIKPGSGSRRAAHARVSKAIVKRSLLAIGKNRVRFRKFLELLFRVRIIRIAVGMVRHRQLTVGALDFDLSRRPAHAEYLVIIAFCVGGQKFPLIFPSEALIKSGFEGDGLQAVRESRKINAALAAGGRRSNLTRVSL